jgi:formate-dependent nitrite reductase membrane component NrfD
MIEHFAGPPEWTWYILFYFFFAGLSGGSYVIASLFRLRGDASDEPAARLGFYVSFAALLPTPVMLILDLGRPLRFWHMMWNTSPDAAGLNFMYWSPMSMGVWALLIFSVFVTVSFAEALVRDGKLRIAPVRRIVGLLGGSAGKVFITLGAAFGLFVAGYTGVLLSVSNQPVWSDTWTLGGLFLASGLSGSAALLLLLTRYRAEARASAGMLTISERLYALLELLLIVIFALSMVLAGALDEAFGFPWILLWLVAFAGLVPGIGGLLTSRLAVTGEGAAVAVPATKTMAMPGLVLIGVLALRASVIFPIQ